MLGSGNITVSATIRGSSSKGGAQEQCQRACGQIKESCFVIVDASSRQGKWNPSPGTCSHLLISTEGLSFCCNLSQRQQNQNCRMGVNRCSHAGCAEAKLMYLHLKTCSAELLEPCPSSHPGCQDSRKLLAHYRRCRDIRARQAQNPAAKSQHHVCLVCSLVARHAKFTLDRKCVSPKAGASSHYIPSLNLSYESNGKNGGSFERGKPSAQPRFAFSRPTSNGSSGFQALQAAVTCALNSKPASSSPLDPISENSTRTGRCGLDKNYYHRPRAESLDVRGSSVTQLQSKGEKNMSYLYLAAVESLEEEPTPSHSRRRSQSCSVPSASSASAVDDCDPIMDKPIGEELQCILGGDS